MTHVPLATKLMLHANENRAPPILSAQTSDAQSLPAKGAKGSIIRGPDEGEAARAADNLASPAQTEREKET